MGEGVSVGTPGRNSPPPPGRRGFKDDCGYRKIIAKYPTIHTVSNKTIIERIFHIRSGDPDPLPLNKLLI
jgi:hypothetical protein